MIEVDEEGTVAAAATAVAVNSRSLGMERNEKMSFTVNHPFLFFLRDLQTGILLFQGRVVDPSGGHSFAIANCIFICFFHLYLYLFFICICMLGAECTDPGQFPGKFKSDAVPGKLGVNTPVTKDIVGVCLYFIEPL